MYLIRFYIIQATNDEVTQSMQQSGEFQQMAINRLKSFGNSINVLSGGSGLSSDSPFKMQAVFNGDQPEHYVESYRLLKKYIEESLDLYKEELQSVLFPMFTQLYLGMIQSQFTVEAKQFYLEEKFQFHFNYKDELKDLELADHTKLGDPNIAKYLTNKFQVKISLYAFQLLIHFVKLNQLILLLNIMNRSLNF